jgi:hypothetical protein
MKRLSFRQKSKQFAYLFYKIGIITQQQKDQIIQNEKQRF